MSTVQQFNGSTSLDVVISVEGLWKQYRYGTISHATLRRDIQSWWARLRGKDDPNLPVDYAPLTKNEELRTKNKEGEADDRFWALQNVNFEVKRGEVLGIIGRNGAGKSTLLKIMSRVTTPTRGQVKIKGRVASLLEVGTGFHPELTGRENTFLNGAILGMTKDEIRRKFDEIVAFAEIEKFIDTPVKRYSSGMYVRLAFAVAAHLEPEILIVDEVLAVGDAAFQMKCLGKMEGIAQEGRTVLFVSHNMTAIMSLCRHAYLFQNGRLLTHGITSDVVNTYMEQTYEYAQIPLAHRKDRKGSGQVRIQSIVIRSAKSKKEVINSADALLVEIDYEAVDAIFSPRFILGIYAGPAVFRLDTEIVGHSLGKMPARGTVICETESINLSPGPCTVNAAVFVNTVLADYIESATTFKVEANDYFGTGKSFDRQETLYLLHHTWSCKENEK